MILTPNILVIALMRSVKSIVTLVITNVALSSFISLMQKEKKNWYVTKSINVMLL